MIKLSNSVMNVAPQYFQQIRSGHKTVEGRIAKEKFCSMRVGQTLEFVSEGNHIQTKILELKQFPSFKQLLQYYGLKNCLPDIDCMDQAVAIYRSFPGYEADEAILGVIGIKVLLIKDETIYE